MRASGKAYAKLNISLDVRSRMPDGYHSMLMVLQSTDLCDDISIEAVSGTGIAIRTNLKYLPCDGRNIAYKAAEAFLSRAGISGQRLTITINKRIPVCAGLGGGSADGAAVLRILDNLFRTGLSASELETLAAPLGSDVPFCAAGGTALATGRGEVLTELPPLPDCFFVICKPSVSISTPKLFSRIDCRKIRCRPDTDGIVAALNAGSLSGVCRRMYNVFESVLEQGADEVSDIKCRLLDAGALGSVMTGTGSAVFGVFEDEKCAAAASGLLSGNYSQCFIARPVSRYL